MLKRLLLVVIVLQAVFALATSPKVQSRVSSTTDPISFIRKYFDHLTSQGQFSGAVLISRGNDILLNEGYGMANIEWNVPNTPDGKFRIASITKQFTAIATLLLQEQGKLNIQDKICPYLKNCPESWANITIDQLLTHTDGLPAFTPSIDLLTSPSVPPDQIISTFINQPLAFKPGEKWEYGSSGYIVLGQIIAAASGQSYEDYIKMNVFNPLDMKDTGFDNSKKVIDHHVTGYANQFVAADFFEPSVFYSAGSIYSTTGDLLKWTRAVFQGKVVSSATIHTLLDKLKGFTNPKGPRYGFEMDTAEGHRYVFKGGSFPGFLSVLYYFPDDDITVVILSNFETTPILNIGPEIFRILFNQA